MPGVVTSMKVASEAACLRIAKYAFKYANRRHRRKVTVFHKANIMKLTDGLFLKCAQRIHEEDYPNIEYEEVIIDAGCMKLIQDPTKFDVLLMENLYGDLVSDMCAGLVGGLGVTPGANIGDDAAVFEAVHGSAPDIAGKGVANPLAQVLSFAMLLRYSFGLDEDAKLIETACVNVLKNGLRTADIMSDGTARVGTTVMGESIMSELDKLAA